MLKSLVCITTCKRLLEVKKYAVDYITFCNNNDDFYFLLALDGNEQNYLSFCEEYEIPLLYSDNREGVGLSKNRVLEKFPDYDYYFFIEDDVELLNPSVFRLHISISIEKGYHHFSISALRNIIKEEKTADGYTITHAMYGGAQFNFFTRESFLRVGGWHTIFAKHKRHGHTEHTYRLFNVGASPSPFLEIKEAKKMILIHEPGSVTVQKNKYKNTGMIKDEHELICERNKFFPIQTLSDYSFNGFNKRFNYEIQSISNKRYPLLTMNQKRKALAEHYLLLSNLQDSLKKRIICYIRFFLLAPFSQQAFQFFLRRYKTYILKKK